MTDLQWTAGLHHDGSALYVSNPTPASGETVTIRLRVPRNAPIREVYLRTAPDGEKRETRMSLEKAAASAVRHYTVSLPITMPRTSYRFRVVAADGIYYLNALRISESEPLDWYDFKLIADFTVGDWVKTAVFYQIFPDRFNNCDPVLTPKPGAWKREGFSVQVREWGAPPLPWKLAGNLDFYGGDLPGIQQKIDYMKELGVNALYLTPIFTSTSNHRYNVQDFYAVDPHLGGNEALIELRDALKSKDIRLMLDVTPNHTSWDHPWFLNAQRDPSAPTAEFYTFNQHPDDYISWLGVRSLPKLNYTSQKLRDCMYRDPDSILLHWLKEPYAIDAWRLDVFNMTARQGELQLGHKIARELRRSVKAEFPECYIIGEHFFDGTPHLQGDELDATMNYRGFNIPLWRWLAGHNPNFIPDPHDPDLVPVSTPAFAEQLAHFAAAIPWIIARQQFHQLDSHDTRRIINIVGGNQAMAKLGAILLMTYPGVPCIYYGDEIGMDGGRDPDNRRCMPWHDPDSWDMDLFGLYKRLIALRKTAPALIEGGFQQLYANGDLWAFQRQSAEQRLIIVAYRGPEPLAETAIPVWHGGLVDGTELHDLLTEQRFSVADGTLTLNNISIGQAFILEAKQS